MKNQDPPMPLNFDHSSTNAENDHFYSNLPPQSIERHKVTFAVDALGRNPEKNVSALCKLKFISKQDGIRFKNEQDLNRHLDLLFAKNPEKNRRLAGRICRLLYDGAENWTKDTSSAAKVNNEVASSHDDKMSILDGNATNVDDNSDVMVVVDENFEKQLF